MYNHNADFIDNPNSRTGILDNNPIHEDMTYAAQALKLVYKEETVPDQWQSQIFARVLMRARVIFISEIEDAVVEEMHIIPAHSLTEAMEIADSMMGKDASVTVIPDGVAVIVK